MLVFALTYLVKPDDGESLWIVNRDPPSWTPFTVETLPVRRA